MAFEEAGFCVVRGPDALWGGDIHTFHPPLGTFDGIIGGPPCQRFSKLAHMVRHNGHELAPDLIPEFARCVNEATPTWFLMENVPAAPSPDTPKYAQHRFLLNNRWLGAEQNRERAFVFGMRGRDPVDLRRWIDYVLLQNPTWAHAVLARGGSRKYVAGRIVNSLPQNAKSKQAVAEHCRLQGLPEDFLSDAPFTVEGKLKCIGNGVPLPMGRALAKAIACAMETQEIQT